MTIFFIIMFIAMFIAVIKYICNSIQPKLVSLKNDLLKIEVLIVNKRQQTVHLSENALLVRVLVCTILGESIDLSAYNR